MNSSITQPMSFQGQSDMKKNMVLKIEGVFLTKLGRKSSTRAPYISRLRTGAVGGTWFVVIFLISLKMMSAGWGHCSITSSHLT